MRVLGRARTPEEAARKTTEPVNEHSERFETIPSDNEIELHSWERGTNQNTNGLVRQCLPKRKSMARVTRRDCNAVSEKLNSRPRKRYDYDTPEERFHAR